MPSVSANAEFEAFYERHWRYVYRLCFSFMRSEADAEDCAEDVFVKVLTGSYEFTDETHERKWLCVTASNLCKDRLGSYGRRNVESLDADDAPEIAAPEEAGDDFEDVREALCNDFRGTTYMKTGDPFATYDTIEAYYRKPAHHVDYNSGYYVTDTIYERSFLNGSNQYGVFLNSNQSTTVVSGDGEGKLLIIKDSYANTFAQFAVDDFEETHLIDMRFFRGSVQKYIERNGITEILVLYNAPNFTADADLTRVDR